MYKLNLKQSNELKIVKSNFLEMDKKILITASILAITGIILGAFGAHKLKQLLSFESLMAFETGVRYQMYHVFLLLFLAVFNKIDVVAKRNIALLIVSGVLLFSGSIYVLSTREVTGLNISAFGVVTPIGGVLLILGWGLLLCNFFKLNSVRP